MINLTRVLIYLFEGIAVTIAIYLVTRKHLQLKEILTLSVTIAVTFLILDLFAPGVGRGSRQGAGFGLGLKQIAGSTTPYPIKYYRDSMDQLGAADGGIVEGMDDPVALQYYQRWNPHHQHDVFPPALDASQYQPGAQVVRKMPLPTEPFDAPPVSRSNWDTRVRSATEVDHRGAPYGSVPLGGSAKSDDSDHQPEPVLYSPLKPTYGYRYQFPRGWDNLEQQGLHNLFNKFRRVSPTEYQTGQT